MGFLTGAALAGLTWKENRATLAAGGEDKGGVTISDAAKVAVSDPNPARRGVQALFEGAMYIFVLQWPPSIAAAITKSFAGAATPYGTVFSCFMVCCLLGSATFGAIASAGVRTEVSTLGMLGFATLAMGAAAAGTGGAAAAALAPLVAAFFCFEACVGMYFPSIGTLRSRYVPDSHRSVIMNLFGIPLNLLVISVFLSIRRLGVSGALRVATGALGLATSAAPSSTSARGHPGRAEVRVRVRVRVRFGVRARLGFGFTEESGRLRFDPLGR